MYRNSFSIFSTITLSMLGFSLFPVLPSQALVLTGSAVVGGYRFGNSNVINPQPTGVSILQKSDLLALSNNQVGAGKVEGKNVFALTEKQNITLQKDLMIFGNYFFSDPNYTQPSAIKNTLTKGMNVSSDLIWVDPVGQGFLNGNGGERLAWEGTLEFKGRILGILPRDIIVPLASRTSQTNAIFGLDGVSYSINQSLDNVFDVVTFNGNTLNFKLTAGDGTDHFRVITAVHTPEPMTILGSFVALCFGGIFKKFTAKKI